MRYCKDMGGAQMLPPLSKSNAKEGACYQFAGGKIMVTKVYRISEEFARRNNLLFLDRAQFDGEAGVFGAELNQGLVLVGVEGLGSLIELLAHDDLAFDEIYFVILHMGYPRFPFFWCFKVVSLSTL